MELGLGDYDVMTNGQLLLDKLGSGDFGKWLLIHGHKHHPKLTYAAGGNSSPVVFSAGSLIRSPLSRPPKPPRNQFYVFDLPSPTMPTPAWSVRAVPGIGQAASARTHAGPTSGLAWKSGFSFLRDIDVLAAKIAKKVITAKSWEKTVNWFPEVSYLVPLAASNLYRVLKEKHNLPAITHDKDGTRTNRSLALNQPSVTQHL